MRLVEGGVAALGNNWLVEGPDGATLILCFGQQESIRQNTIAFTHNNTNGSLQPSVCFLSSGVSSFSSWKPAVTALTTTDRWSSFPVCCLNHAATISSKWPICTFLLAIRCFSSLVSEILLAIATHTCNCACYSWAISIHFYSLHVGKRHVLYM